MSVYIHHVALKTTDLEASVKFFQEVFGMTVEKILGEAPNRKLWFDQGVQLNEVASYGDGANAFDHFAINVDDIPAVMDKVEAYGCTRLPGKDHWFAMPDGLLIELMSV